MVEVATKALAFSNGREIPLLGLGTWKSKLNEVKDAVKYAIQFGYRHIDTAYIYDNESDIGDAIRECIDTGIVKREELFVTTKLWITFHRPDLVESHCRQQLKSLQLDYIDLYLMHLPIALQENGDKFPKNEKGEFLFSEVDYLDTWKAMQKLVDAGIVRSLGISNFNSRQIQRVLDADQKHKPVNLQIEISPYWPNTKLIDFAKSKGLVVTAYSPFGSPDRPGAKPEDRVIFNEEIIGAVANKHNKTPAQVVLRWVLQHGCVVIPKSVTSTRIKENMQIFDFELSDEDMKSLSSFEHSRVCAVPSYSAHKYYPFHDEF